MLWSDLDKFSEEIDFLLWLVIAFGWTLALILCAVAIMALVRDRQKRRATAARLVLHRWFGV